MEGEKTFRPHVLMLPWLALGHIIPHLELAKLLCNRGLRVHLCSTSSILSSLRQKLQQKSYSAIETIEFRLPTIPGLPSHYESTSTLPPHLMPLLKMAFHSCKPAITSILTSLNPDFIIHDFFPTWISTLAAELNIHGIQFITFNASAFCFYCSFFTEGTTRTGSDSLLGGIKLHEFESQRVDKLLLDERNNMKAMGASSRTIEGSESVVILKTVRSFEAQFVDYAQELTGKKVIPVGALAPHRHDQQQQQGVSHQSLDSRFTEWLNARMSSSVVFASFGSEYFMSKDEITEIAFGLELCDQSFIWVIRLAKEQEEAEAEAEEGASMIQRVLPLGFLERVKGRGLVVSGWAPQTAILSHPATGGFLTHCGWGSLCEGMGCGVPFIALPLTLDQPINARLVVGDLGLGAEVEREKNGDFRREKVAEGIRRVMVGQEGQELRRRAKEMVERIKDESDRGVEELLRRMETMYHESCK